MRFILASWAIPFAIATSLATSPAPRPASRSVAYFEPPRSIGTPIDDIARSYRGVSLADRIVGRFRLDTDRSLTEAARVLIRRRLALGS